MLSLSSNCRYYLCRQATDMRKGLDSLSGLVRNGLSKDPLSGEVFIFFNTRRNQVKLLLWEQDGFAMYYKRLEKGTYELPVFTADGSSAELDSDQLMFILKGISLKSVRRRERFDLKKNIFQQNASSGFSSEQPMVSLIRG